MISMKVSAHQLSLKPRSGNNANSYPRSNIRHLLFAGIACLLALPSAPAQTVSGSGLTRLDVSPLINPTATVAGATAINNSGQAVGNATIGGYDHAVIYSGGSVTDLGTLGGSTSYALAINDAGQVVGFSTIAGGQKRAFLYSGGIMTNLGALGGTSSQAFGINNSGDIIGSLYNAPYSPFAQRAFLYSGGTMSDLGTLGGNNAIAGAINNAGQIAGQSENSSGTFKVFIYAGGVMTNLGLTINLDSLKRVNGINASGKIVGTFGDHAFLASAGVVTDLGTLQGSPNANAMAINSAGWIVGGSHNRAYVYIAGTMIDLNTIFAANLITDGVSEGFVSLQQANGINDAGQIVGFGSYRDGGGNFHQAAFELTVTSVIAEPRPSLSIKRSGNEVEVSWPVGQVAYTLHSTPVLPPVSWTAITSGITQSGGRCSYNTVPVGNIYYRLQAN